jgi:metal-responsive CopG/Arc/MetJ family transcriptional regulator
MTVKKVINIPERMAADLALLSREFGFVNETELIRTAVRDKILELKRLMFARMSDEVARGLRERGASEREVLEGFERARRP